MGRRRRDRIDVRRERISTSIAGVIALSLCLIVVLGPLPAEGLLFILHRLSTRSGDAVHLAAAGWIAIVLLLGTIFMLSNLVGALAKTICTPRRMSWPFLVALNLGIFACAATLAVYLQEAASGLHASAKDDNSAMLIATAVWLWAAANATTPIFAELLDRLNVWVDGKVSA